MRDSGSLRIKMAITTTDDADWRVGKGQEGGSINYFKMAGCPPKFKFLRVPIEVRKQEEKENSLSYSTYSLLKGKRYSI